MAMQPYMMLIGSVVVPVTPDEITTKYKGNWCAMFVSYVMSKAGVPTSVVPKTASVQALYDFAKKNRRFKTKNSGYEPKGGDIMIQKSNGANINISEVEFSV